MFSTTRIPTVLGLLLLIVVVGGVIISFESFSRLPIRATGSIQPDAIQITNLSDTSFTITWTTPTPATGALIISAPGAGATIFDERDSDGKLRPYLTHSVTVRNLKGDTSYEVKILSQGKTYMDNGTPYRIRTFPILTTNPQDMTPAYGSVVTADNQSGEGALVFLTLEGSQMLSALVKPSGAWIIPLHRIRALDGSTYLPMQADRMNESLLVKNNGLSTSAITDTLNDSPVPVMVLGKNYDFRKQQGKAPEALPIAEAPIAPPKILGAQTTREYTVSLVAPAQSAAIASQLPLIQGTGIPSKLVTITLGITNPISDTTTVQSDGMFRYTPTSPLAPGKQMVTITTRDAQNKPVAITHAFEILKSGTQVLGDATPSATLTPTETPTPTPALVGQPLPESATTFPTVILITIGAMLFLGGTVALMKK